LTGRRLDAWSYGSTTPTILQKQGTMRRQYCTKVPVVAEHVSCTYGTPCASLEIWSEMYPRRWLPAWSRTSTTPLTLIKKSRQGTQHPMQRIERAGDGMNTRLGSRDGRRSSPLRSVTTARWQGRIASLQTVRIGLTRKHSGEDESKNDQKSQGEEREPMHGGEDVKMSWGGCKWGYPGGGTNWGGMAGMINRQAGAHNRRQDLNNQASASPALHPSEGCDGADCSSFPI
jgi:hypothetical protein